MRTQDSARDERPLIAHRFSVAFVAFTKGRGRLYVNCPFGLPSRTIFSQ